MKLTVETAFRLKLADLMRYAKTSGNQTMAVHWNNEVAVIALFPNSMTVKHGGRVFDVGISSYGEKPLVRYLYQTGHARTGGKASLFLIDGGLKCQHCAGLLNNSNSGRERERLAAKQTKVLAKLKAVPGQIPSRRPRKMDRMEYIKLLNELAGTYRSE